MKIEDARVIVASPGRNYVTLKIVTDGGIYGIGDATLNGRELAVASYLSEHVVPLLIGREAMNIEDTWQLLYRSAYRRPVPGRPARLFACLGPQRRPDDRTGPYPHRRRLPRRARPVPGPGAGGNVRRPPGRRRR